MAVVSQTSASRLCAIHHYITKINVEFIRGCEIETVKVKGKRWSNIVTTQKANKSHDRARKKKVWRQVADDSLRFITLILWATVTMSK